MQNIVNQQCASVFKTLAFGIDRNKSEAECRYHSFSSVKDGINVLLFVCFCCFTSHVNSYGHCGTVSSLNHTFSWAGLSKRLTSNLCTYFRL